MVDVLVFKDTVIVAIYIVGALVVHIGVNCVRFVVVVVGGALIVVGFRIFYALV